MHQNNILDLSLNLGNFMAKNDHSNAKKASSKKICACGQAKRCSNLQQQLTKLKYDKFVGYIRVQTKYTSADRSKVAERHRRICAHIKLLKGRGDANKAVPTDSRVDVAYHHFDNDMIVKYDGITETINFEESRQIGFVDNADRCCDNSGRFWFCPTMPNEKNNELE